MQRNVTEIQDRNAGRHTQFLCLRADMMFSLEDRRRETDKPKEEREGEHCGDREGREKRNLSKLQKKRNKMSAKQAGNTD